MKKLSYKAARVNAGYTQKQAAKILGVDPKTLIKWEAYKTHPTAPKALQMAQLYGVSLNDFFIPQKST